MERSKPQGYYEPASPALNAWMDWVLLQNSDCVKATGPPAEGSTGSIQHCVFKKCTVCMQYENGSEYWVTNSLWVAICKECKCRFTWFAHKDLKEIHCPGCCPTLCTGGDYKMERRATQKQAPTQE